jgi:cellulose synthase/poly-beta-1,6-N-acetylglucosamine synthase-like glycosyltransferase
MASASIASPLPDDQGPSPSHGGGRPVPLLPLVTIVMPIRNEARYIARALHAVLAQAYPVDKVEIFVIDGMSEDGTRAIVTAMAVGEPRVQFMDKQHLANLSGKICFHGSGMTAQSVNVVGCSASNFAGSAHLPP